MALFEPHPPPERDELMGSDAATRALSVTAVENDFVNGVYDKLASVYDWTFGPTLHAGRVQAIQRMGIQRGDQVLEVGVGTGINAGLYPRDCAVTGIDLSTSMLEKARDRVARKGISNVRLLEMDAADIKFGDGTFDIVYAPYLISVVPDPVAVAKEMNRVCRSGGRIIILNHFRSAARVVAAVERAISPFTVHIGFTADLDLPAFLAQADLKPVSIEKVNIPRIWSLVTCIKE
jgi:phosphatidylethanolamine/phosphatidyl-N-methylethanolamine N-methyltransferase